ncbi:614/534 cytochrome P450 [Coprinopsis cinerea okayama7|uniref:614/534 cytochrome P450 n=1 Tax=Coprinopsis cinerea (strain Okayama-7 / 130 / ATCC MYA-4618 / FGSC 9003) TaxID=240176 RepID=A8N5Y5_COPC7|nr:614/534 cytochrome P450 [Coprinopsis cinerea okayama7\|eukprot:XP_001830280.2 614/534 cytochrome P450 [Coprinopsis cinerea okayama7\
MPFWPSPYPYTVQTSLILFVAPVIAFVCHRAVSILKAKRAIGFHPGEVFFLFPGGVISNFVMPSVRWLSAGKNYLFVNKFKKYEDFGSSVYSIVRSVPKGQLGLEVTSARAKFPKAIALYKSLLFFGQNIVASEGNEWKRYRRISAPAFSEKNSKLVWDETVRVMDGLFDLWDGRGERKLTVDHCLDITLPIALFVIGAAGFGQRMPWTETDRCPEGHQMTFKESLQRVAHDVFVKLAVPEWAMGLTKRTRTARLAFKELDLYMKEMIHERLYGEKVERNDLFSILLESNSDASIDALTEQELTGNIFMFLIAGHETAAHTLCFTFALLALYPEEQELLFQSIKAVCPDGEIAFSDMPKLTRAMAVFNETMRLFPPVTNIPKESAEDTTLTLTNDFGERVTIPVPKGTQIAINTAGLHYNPRYWEDPHEFNPDRFLQEYNKDAFLPFSSGVRSCLGKRFFECEGIATLTKLVSRYRISVKEEPQYAYETFEQRKERVLRNKPGITVTPIRVPLVFTRRD